MSVAEQTNNTRKPQDLIYATAMPKSVALNHSSVIGVPALSQSVLSAPLQRE